MRILYLYLTCLMCTSLATAMHAACAEGNRLKLQQLRKKIAAGRAQQEQSPASSVELPVSSIELSQRNSVPLAQQSSSNKTESGVNTPSPQQEQNTNPTTITRSVEIQEHPAIARLALWREELTNPDRITRLKPLEFTYEEICYLFKTEWAYPYDPSLRSKRK